MRCIAIAWFLFGTATACASDHVVWQIGRPDDSYKEFAIAADYGAFGDHFSAQPLVFTIGTSRAVADWPFIHPGPVDAWAGRRVHPFTIRFSLADPPRGTFTLQVALADTQGSIPPVYAITVGGRTGRFSLPPGGGDSSLTNPARGKRHKIVLDLPAEFFHLGINEIQLACVEGSWVQYDAITLLNDPDRPSPKAGIQTIRIRPTPFFIRDGNTVRRAVDVELSLTAPPDKLTLRVEAGGETIEVPVTRLPVIGSVSQEVGIPDSTKPLSVKVTALAGRQAKSATVLVPPQRKWRVYVAPSAHTDIGYTDIQPKCVARHNENIDMAAKLIEAYPKSKWNCEVAWQAENYLAMRQGAQRERFLQLAHYNRIGIQALYANILTGLCSHEELCRLTYAANRIKRAYGIPYTSAMIDDVPTWVAALPMILSNSGIRYFSGGSNNTRAVTFTQMYNKSPCWWEGPDGSRVLMMFQPGYAQAARLGLCSSLAIARQRLMAKLHTYERADYPYDAVYVNGAVSDNQPLNVKLAEVAKQWNARYAFPHIILCTNAEFFQYIEQNFADKLPVFRGSGGTYWEDGAGSSARETALCRNAHETIGAAEKLLALSSRLGAQGDYPRKEIDDCWRLCMLYDEHTWGAHCSISQPDSDFTKAQWKIKAQYAHDAHDRAGRLLERGAKRLAGLVKTADKSLVVLNTMSWPRNGVLAVRLPEGTGIVDPPSSTCRVGKETLVSVKDIPSCGYRRLRLGPTPDAPEAISSDGNVIESRFYRVTFDRQTGAVVSLIDRQLNRELVDTKAPHQLNQYLYVAGGKGSALENPGPPPKLDVSTTRQARLERLELGRLKL